MAGFGAGAVAGVGFLATAADKAALHASLLARGYFDTPVALPAYAAAAARARVVRARGRAGRRRAPRGGVPGGARPDRPPLACGAQSRSFTLCA
ncbi:MAG: hypothetical protein VX113_09295, partial [Pseudomonadota bacterium]|nr:hypothetical protein [Pseudomonadota bacterium]